MTSDSNQRFYPPEELDGPVTAELEQEFRQVFAHINDHVQHQNARFAAAAANIRAARHPVLAAYSQDEIDGACHDLRHGFDTRLVAAPWTKWTRAVHASVFNPLRRFLEHADLKPVHLIRCMLIVGYLARRQQDGRVGFMFNSDSLVDVYRAAHSPPLTLEALADALARCGLSPDLIADDMLESWIPRFDWEPEAVWPYFAHRVDRLAAELASPGDADARWNWRYRVNAVFHLIAKFPHLPPELADPLWETAIGGAKTEREPAQRALERSPDLHDRLAEALASRRFQTRAIAAEWLGRLGDRSAAVALHAAAAKEKQDTALDAQLTALERLGEPIDRYLDRGQLQAEAEKGLKKGLPKKLAWFPWHLLPPVRWGDTGEEVPVEVIQWLLVQSHKKKSPEAGPLLSRYCAMFETSQRQSLGGFVLGVWLAQDLRRKYTDAEARALAQQQAPQTWQSNQQYVQWCRQQGHPVPAMMQMSQQQVEDALFESLQRECGSATADKGVLAVAAACCGEPAVMPVRDYLNRWYGYRAAQCKALVAMLSCIDCPAAIQFLLSIANRFRTKGIRQEAEKYVHLLAERKGWTLDELADRTLTTAGFDDEGKLILDYGPRRFVARVNADLKSVLQDDEGNTLKSLPAPRKDDDDQQAAAAKKALSAAKSELKKFVGQQTTRLYEAMCAQRLWEMEDWRVFLLGHPLMRLLCQRLVWLACDRDTIRQTFRPLDDGTLTDCGDNEVMLDESVRIGIAHRCLVSADVAADWSQHLADYAVSPLFPQFDHEPYVVPEERRRGASLDDFEGHLVEAFTLRNLATRFGYTRGEAQDGGWFFEYLRILPGLGLEVHLGFSGNGLPEENRVVALTSLSFHKTAPQQTPRPLSSPQLPLGDIPAVLLSETHHQLRTIAAAGSGFDPDWEQAVGR
jgi:hypothetical protein